MEDAETQTLDSSDLEIWIHRQLKQRYEASYIADELLKFWEKKRLTFEAKKNVARFCILNGFYPSLIRILKVELRSGDRIPWGLVVETLNSQKIPILKKDLSDALLAGASRDKQLFEAAVQALKGSADPRWQKVYDEELKEVVAKLQDKRNQIMDDIKIFDREGMHEEVKESVSMVLAIFPKDPEAKKLDEKFKQADLMKSVENIRRRHQSLPKTLPSLPKEEHWPELETVLKTVVPKLDLDAAYHLAIGLTEMGFFKNALDLLNSHKAKWTRREQLMEIEILNSQEQFLQALEASQSLLKQASDEPETVYTCLYNLAKSYKGLDDISQAMNILKALVNQRPDYRDAAVLLRQWESTSQ